MSLHDTRAVDWLTPRPTMRTQRSPSAARDRAVFMDWVAFALGVFILLIYSEAWVGPLTGDKPGADDAALIRGIYYPAYAASLVILIGCLGDSLRALLRAPLMVLFVGMAAVSMFWSVDPDATMRRAVAVVLTTLGGVVLATRFDWTRLAQVLATCFAVLVIVSLVLGAFVPSIGRMENLFPGSWRGPWIEKNTLGGFMALGLAIFGAAALLDKARWWLWSAFGAAAIALVILSGSKTALVALALAAVSLGFVWLARRGPAMGVIMVWLGVVALGAAAAVILFEPQWIFALLDKDATLTGRTKIWTAAIRQIHSHPWFGYGYGAVWDNKDPWGPFARITDEAGFPARHAHSSWIEMTLYLGFVGAGLWALWFVETWIRALVSIFTTRGAYLAVPVLAVYALTSLSESVTLTWNDLRWVLFTAMAVKLAIGERTGRTQVKIPVTRDPIRF